MERLIEKDQDLAWIKGHLSDSCTEMCEEVSGECWRCDIMVCMERLADYEDAEERGRLLKLPFTFGDIIYEISESRPEIYEWTIKGFQIFKDATYICVNDYTWINIAKLGKTIFRTLDEARAKLKEMEDDDNGNL